MGRTTEKRKPIRRARPARRRSRRSTGKPPALPSGEARSIASFYDRIAGDYDAMTNFEHRFLREGQMLRMLVVKNNFVTALDAGCGTGFHALFLARLGVKVTAVDISAKMVKQVLAHAREMGVHVEAIRQGFAGLTRRLRKKFDAVLCMGNTLAHLRAADELRKTLKAFATLLNPGSFLVLQVLNYDRIVKLGPLPQIVRETPVGTFIRTYETRDDRIRLTIEHRRPGHTRARRQSLDLRPVYHTELLTLLEQAGYGEIELFGSIEMEPFDPAASNDIVIVARK
jgi:2-polyprenyl-3-methyl-5-hydroxy-6-metoxy-1,4-benzoquinol methylase